MTEVTGEKLGLHQAILECLHSVSPTRREELNELIRKLSVTFQLDVKGYRVNDFWAAFPSHTVNIPRLCLFRLKAHAYSYIVVLNDILAAREQRGVDNAEKRKQLVNEVLMWATKTDIATSDQDGSEHSLGCVPEALDRMLNDPAIENDAIAAEEGFRRAVAWMIHHELAHIRLGHSDAVDADIIAQEREADCLAIDWLLSGQTEEAELIASIYGITVGLGWLACLRVYLDEEDDQHGSACVRFIDRLEYLSKQLNSEMAEFAWGVAHVILYLHGRNQKLTISDTDMQGRFCEIAKRLVSIIEASKVH